MPGQTDTPDPRYAVPALEKALDILEALSLEPAGLTLGELARRVGRKPTEVFRVVEVLKRRGYLAPERGSERLVLTLRLFELAHRQPQVHRLIAEALPIMNELARTTGQSCHLAVHSGGEMLVIAQVDGPRHMGFAVKVGARVGLTTSSSGRVYLAFQSEADRDRILAPAAPKTPAEGRRIERKLSEIARQGYDAVPSDLLEGIVNMSYPVLDHGGRAIASLTVPFLHWKAAAETASREATREALGAAAARLSAQVGPAASAF